MGEAGERYLIAAWDVEAELAEAEIRAGPRPAIENGPAVTVLDLMDNFRGADADLDDAELSLVAFIGHNFFQ